jgi:hypothetical protein
MDPMSAEVSFSCIKHPMTMGESICGECGHQFCHECVVYPFGTTKPPLCISCALERGGVRRQTSPRPKLARKSIKERLALQRQALEGPAPTGAPATLPAGAGDDDAWLAGDVDPSDVPGAWREQY